MNRKLNAEIFGDLPIYLMLSPCSCWAGSWFASPGLLPLHRMHLKYSILAKLQLLSIISIHLNRKMRFCLLLQLPFNCNSSQLQCNWSMQFMWHMVWKMRCSQTGSFNCNYDIIAIVHVARGPEAERQSLLQLQCNWSSSCSTWSERWDAVSFLQLRYETFNLACGPEVVMRPLL